MDGHGTSPEGRCEGIPDPSEVSSPGKLSVFSKSPIGTLGELFITVLRCFEILLHSHSDMRYTVSEGKHPQNRDGMSTHCVIECSNCVVEKTVRRDGRAWYISRGEM